MKKLFKIWHMHTNECPKYVKVLIRILKEVLGKYWESTVKIPVKYQVFKRKLQGIYHKSNGKVLGKYKESTVKMLEKYQKSTKKTNRKLLERNKKVPKNYMENTWKVTQEY